MRINLPTPGQQCVCLHLSTHTQHAHAQDIQKLFVSHMRASHASVWFCRAVASVCLRLAAHSPVGFGRISPHLAQEEERASHSEGLHWLTRAYTRTCPHLLACILHIKKSKKNPHAFRHTQTHSRWSRSFRHRDIGFRELISKYYELEKFGEESRALKREHISALCTTPAGLFWRESKYFYPHAERSWRFFMLL